LPSLSLLANHPVPNDDGASSGAPLEAGHSIASIVDWAIERDRRERSGGGAADDDNF
jgi:hypothetical protein